MGLSKTPESSRRPFRQRGAVLFIILTILGIGVGVLLVAGLLRATSQIENDKQTADALAKAKDALIGYALRGDDALTPSRPGVFPCPDTHVPTDPTNPANDPLYGTSVSPCSDGAIGRFPWRTLGTAELLDGSGAPIWYALSGNFRNTASLVNSDSKGTLQVRAADGIGLLTPQGSEAVAILFSPGAPLAGQARGTAVEKNTAANYLEAVGTISNATGASIAGNCNVLNQGGAAQTSCPTFIAGDRSATFNDRLLVITPRDFIPIVERRVARVAEGALTGYFTTCGYYPRPASFSNAACLPGGNTNGCIPDTVATQGRFPFYAKTDYASLTMTDWVGLPNWFLGNRWDRVTYYAVAPGYVLGAGSQSCPTNCLTVDADSSVRRLILMPGNATDASNPRPSVTLTDYLGDAENTDIDNIFVTPTAAALDQLFKLPRSGVAIDSSPYTPTNPNTICGASTYAGLGSGNTGQSSITLADGTTVSVTGSGNASIYVSNSGIGVDSGSGAKSLNLGNGEQMTFAFPDENNSLGILVGMLKKNDVGYIAFRNNGTVVGSATLKGCSSADQSIFNNIAPAGNPVFDEVILTAATSNGFYVNKVSACAGASCAITGAPAGAATCASWTSP